MLFFKNRLYLDWYWMTNMSYGIQFSTIFDEIVSITNLSLNFYKNRYKIYCILV